MCRDCGCEQGNERSCFHEHDGHGPHSHPRPPKGAGGGGRDHHHGSHSPGSRGVELGQRGLARNGEAAGRNRGFLARRGIVALNLISGPGAGKTALLQATLDGLAGRLGCAVIVGDQQTDNDARRLAGRGAPVRQIETRSACHLNAEQVGDVLDQVVGDGTRLLLIENVGNLVCPAAFDLGEQHQVALLSVTEGEDKPLKYPVLFHNASIVLITKTDLLPHLDWDREAALAAIRSLRPDAEIIETSARSGAGLPLWLGRLERPCRPAPAPPARSPGLFMQPAAATPHPPAGPGGHLRVGPQGRHVVEAAGTRIYRRPGDHRRASIDGNRHGRISPAKPFDHRDDPANLLGGGYRLGAGTGRFAPNVDQVRPIGDHRPCSGQRVRGVQELPAVAERIGRPRVVVVLGGDPGSPDQQLAEGVTIPGQRFALGIDELDLKPGHGDPRRPASIEPLGERPIVVLRLAHRGRRGRAPPSVT